MAELEKISWIGCGRVGRTLARALKEAGYQIGTIQCKHIENSRRAAEFIRAGEPLDEPTGHLDSSSVHFIATNDDAIPEIVQSIDRKGPKNLAGKFFFHTSGSIGSDVFDPLVKKGAEAGSIHPLQVFADENKALETLPGIYYAIEGSERAMSLAVQMVDRLQGKLLLIPTGRKVLYHIAGVFAANYLTVLVNLALMIMEDLGETPDESYQAFLPLMVGALQNIEEFGVAGALTGPISRGDEETIRKHKNALEELSPEIRRAYNLLGQEAVEIAARGGKITPEKARRLLDLLQ